MAVKRKMLVILGATASGKSELALRLAEEIAAEILSVDSMQVYRKMDIGTAKPTADEQRRAKHHLIDVVDPNELFTTARFVELADTVIGDGRGPLIATGGTPLYYKALFEGMFEGPGASAEIRDRLRALSNDELHRRLLQVDPVAAARIHVNDTKRLIRALEVHELTGEPISALQQQWAAGGAGAHRHPAVWVGLDWDREALNRRINSRVKAMIAAGWVEETRRLLDEFSELSQTAAEATGYHELIEHLRGRMPLEDAIEQIKIATRQLARRQMKWLRRFPNVTWLGGDTAIEQKLSAVRELWK